jgi:ferredoxin
MDGRVVMQYYTNYRNHSDVFVFIHEYKRPGFATTQYEGFHDTGDFVLSGLKAHALSNLPASTLLIIERSCWWLHIVGIFVFLNYLPGQNIYIYYFAFPNAYYARLQPAGKMINMPAIQNEVLYAMQPELAPTETQAPPKFGAKDIMDLSWRNLLDAYSCTECGRCTAACPANLTGKLLSPRKIMMDTRDRMEEVGRNINSNKTFTDDGNHFYIIIFLLKN